MRIPINEENFGIYYDAEKILKTSYMNCTNDDECKGYIEDYEVESMIEDLCSYIDDLKEKIKDMEQDIEDNYIPRPKSDYTGDSYDDRF